MSRDTSDRNRRLADALRANLRRRKSRARDVATGETVEDRGEDRPDGWVAAGAGSEASR